MCILTKNFFGDLGRLSPMGILDPYFLRGQNSYLEITAFIWVGYIMLYA